MQYYFLGVGIIITLLAACFTIQHIYLFLMGHRASGEVVDVEERLRFSGNRNKKTYFHAVIEFDDAEGLVFDLPMATDRRRGSLKSAAAFQFCSSIRTRLESTASWECGLGHLPQSFLAQVVSTLDFQDRSHIAVGRLTR